MKKQKTIKTIINVSEDIKHHQILYNYYAMNLLLDVYNKVNGNVKIKVDYLIKDIENEIIESCKYLDKNYEYKNTIKL